MRYVWINKGYISKIASTMTGGFYAFLGLIGTFVSLNEILPDTMPVWIRGIISVAILIGIWGCCFVVVSIRLARKKRFKASPHNSAARLAMPFPPSAACKFLDLHPVNLRNLHLHLTKNPFASRPPHLRGVTLKFFLPIMVTHYIYSMEISLTQMK